LPAAADRAVLQALGGLQALDVSAGLGHMGHNTVLYLSMLRKFLQAQARGMEPLVLCLAEGDLATTERLAHTL
jgi:hypothetical protein